MEALSGAASGIAVASLAIQLMQSVDAIRSFVRNVNNATNELVRIKSLLDHLEALLQDVRDILEQQTHGKYFPTPSLSVLSCLRSCEESLSPLHIIMAKHQRSQERFGLARLRDSVKLGLKANEIATFESRLQQGMGTLSTALAVNSTSIQLNILPIILNKQSILLSRLGHQQAAPEQYRDGNATSYLATSWIRTTQVNTSSALKLFGVHQTRWIRQKSLRKAHGALKDFSNGATCPDLVRSEELFFQWGLLGYGLRWSQQKPYGNIFPSLRIYPVVNRFDAGIRSLMDHGTVSDFQRKFQSGSLHPYTRDRSGWSLYYLATAHSRPDICALLCEYGLSSDPDCVPPGYASIVTPMMFATAWRLFSPATDTARVSRNIDVYRFLLQHYHEDPVFLEAASDCHVSFVRHKSWLEEAKWLCGASSNYLVGEERTKFQNSILKGLLARLICGTNDEGLTWIKQALRTATGASLLSEITDGSSGLLKNIFGNDAIVDHEVGKSFIATIQELGVDVQKCMSGELAGFPAISSRQEHRFCPGKKITFSTDSEGNNSLDWEWDYDNEAPGYLVITTYPAFAADIELYSLIRTEGYLADKIMNWPFQEPRHSSQIWSATPTEPWRSRRRRQRVRKERKERARLGRRQSRSRMPGTWVF